MTRMGRKRSPRLIRFLLPAALLLAAVGCAPRSPAGDGGTRGVSDPASDTGSTRVERRFDEALLHLRVRTALLEHLQTQALGVRIDIAGDSAVLRGHVSTHANRTLAEEVALSVDGVADVDNQIEVTPAEGEGSTPVAKAVGTAERKVNDALLETRVQTRLVRELGELGFHIDVEAADGEVILRGTVPDRSHKRIALNAAAKVKGVRKVHDLLKIRD
jgi:hyperosmotically inducible protein